MKKFLNSRLGIRAAKGSVVAGAVLLASNANAALPAEATSAVTDVTTFATDMIAAAWPIVALITVGSIGIKLFKKFTNKAT
jgi:Inoviridae major coat protein